MGDGALTSGGVYCSSSELLEHAAAKRVVRKHNERNMNGKRIARPLQKKTL